MPIVTLAGCLFMIIAACFCHKAEVVPYLIIIAVVMIIGIMICNRKLSNKASKTSGMSK
jgi:basic amino acid/polyamine antiporter, APA family